MGRAAGGTLAPALAAVAADAAGWAMGFTPAVAFVHGLHCVYVHVLPAAALQLRRHHQRVGLAAAYRVQPVLCPAGSSRIGIWVGRKICCPRAPYTGIKFFFDTM